MENSWKSSFEKNKNKAFQTCDFWFEDSYEKDHSFWTKPDSEVMNASKFLKN